MTPSDNAQRVVERYVLEVLEAAVPAALEDLVSNEALRQHARAMRRSFGPLEVTIHVLIDAVEYVAVHLTVRGVHRGMFQGVQPTGRTWTASCSALFRVEAGRISDFWMTWDALAILEQVGGLERRPSASA